jgi:hypothetical protein
MAKHRPSSMSRRLTSPTEMIVNSRMTVQYQSTMAVMPLRSSSVARAPPTRPRPPKGTPPRDDGCHRLPSPLLVSREDGYSWSGKDKPAPKPPQPRDGGKRTRGDPNPRDPGMLLPFYTPASLPNEPHSDSTIRHLRHHQRSDGK